MKIRYAAKTDVGMKRTHNEDYFSLLEEDKLFMVADGMGGHAMGEVASKMAADTIGEFYARTKDEDATWPFKMDRQLSYAENRLICGIKLANLRIFEAANRDPRCRGMGTTLVSALVNDNSVLFAHVGDSRGYLLRGNTIKQITRDHSLLEDYKEAKPDMTADEEKNFPHKNVITRALGMRDTVDVDLKRETLAPGDAVLLCCDGLSGMIEDKHIAETVALANGDIDKAVGMLIDLANKNGGVDNITAILLTCSNDP